MPTARMCLLYWLTRRPILLQWVQWSRGRLTAELSVMLEQVSPGYVVFDVGANQGYFTRLYSLLVGRHGRVYAFEPVPTTFRVLQERMAEQQVIPNIDLINVALADTSGTAVMYLPGQNDVEASLLPHRGVGSWRTADPPATFQCRQIRLDDFVRDRGLTRLDFLKCDVEGAELLVLRGATDTLKQFQPVLYLEVSPDWTVDFGYHPTAIIEFLRPLGYNRFLLVTAERSHPQPTGAAQLKSLTGSANLLCLPIQGR
ncbi:MAG: FkbM family methyltransferase [Planctomycetaceae bacterium]|nr:FkbM family methyltransferase [Planctomycetaceae bacterium]MBV8312923.1 FkbM family methyltransferase [Planctomycetaceae bacterium]